MNKPLDPAAPRDGFETFADLDAFLKSYSEGKAKRHGKPFSKRVEGRERRAERKAKEARRFDWFNA
ncbi:MAG: hypothetical protein E5V63_29640 [Mesorhizobium sp.]|nr:MAG: hypothetical protein E5V63_29640 [Mesorhizobium sp.]